MIEFDCIKMWESLLNWAHPGVPKEAIASALKEQGFKFDGKHIVLIEEYWGNPPKISPNYPEPGSHDGDLEPTAPIKMSVQPSFEESQGEQPTVVLYGLTNCTSEEKSELTEFENKVNAMIWCSIQNVEQIDVDAFTKKWSKELISIARKQFLEEDLEWNTINVEAQEVLDSHGADYGIREISVRLPDHTPKGTMYSVKFRKILEK